MEQGLWDANLFCYDLAWCGVARLDGNEGIAMTFFHVVKRNEGGGHERPLRMICQGLGPGILLPGTISLCSHFLTC
jgi:hypothetical protein